jgi:hypothetical protein
MGIDDRDARPAKVRPETPFFSVILPVWNRREVIGRCLESLWSQDFDQFEVVAVDDGSTDQSLAVLRACNDPRLVVMAHDVNRGVCAARATATAAARGAWHLTVDSDWTLDAGSMRRLAQLARAVPPDVGWIGAYARSNKGELWPVNPMPEGPFGFEEYLRWSDKPGPSDHLSCRRREVAESVPWPTDRRLEVQMILRIARRWRFHVLREPLATIYTDCTNRYQSDDSAEGLARKMDSARDQAVMTEEVLEEFGADLRQFSPSRYAQIVESAAQYNLQAGRRWRGLKFSFRALARRPLSIRLWTTMFLGLLGPRLIRVMGRVEPARKAYRMLSRLGSHDAE